MLVLSLFAGACGVQFSDPPKTHQVFQSLTISGQMRAGAPLTAALKYQQNLPVAIKVQCEIRQGSTLVKPIGIQTVAEQPGGSPKQTPVPGNFSFDFTLDRPGAYKAECYAPDDQDVYIIKEFSIAGPAVTPRATP